MSLIDTSHVFTRRAGLASAELDGELLLFEEDTGTIHVLNATAAEVWSCFDGVATVGEIVAELASAYGVDPQTVEADVVPLLAQLSEEALLDVNHGDGA